MAVKFTENGFTVTAEDKGDGCYLWLYIVTDLIDLLSSCDKDIRASVGFYYTFELLKAMLPDEEQLKKLIE